MRRRARIQSGSGAPPPPWHLVLVHTGHSTLHFHTLAMSIGPPGVLPSCWDVTIGWDAGQDASAHPSGVACGTPGWYWAPLCAAPGLVLGSMEAAASVPLSKTPTCTCRCTPNVRYEPFVEVRPTALPLHTLCPASLALQATCLHSDDRNSSQDRCGPLIELVECTTKDVEPSLEGPEWLHNRGSRGNHRLPSPAQAALAAGCALSRHQTMPQMSLLDCADDTNTSESQEVEVEGNATGSCSGACNCTIELVLSFRARLSSLGQPTARFGTL